MISSDKKAALGLLALRLSIATTFLYHGWTKLMFWTAAPAGAPAWMVWLMRFLFVIEIIGGIALVVGFLTRWAALGFSLIMLGAIYFKIAGLFGAVVPYSSGNTTGWEFDLVILGGCLALAGVGAGCLALDCKLCRGKMTGKTGSIKPAL
ncbi:MAG: hypothetical protein JWM56_32 [Candidatus Peribacteria bacterium]|nr:hypothetical protein [Candidatus Peribacteria bacterium]